MEFQIKCEMKMLINKKIFNCCLNEPEFLITYSVAKEEKTYAVCRFCVNLECFTKYILRKEIIK